MVHSILYVCKWIGVYEILFIMYILTVDRLICITGPLRYKSRVTRSRIKMAVLTSCVASVGFGILEYFHPTIRYVLIFLGSVYTILTIVTYTFIILERNRSRKMSNPDDTADNLGGNRKEMLVPGLIILSFLLLCCVPHLIHFFMRPMSVIDRKMVELFMMLGLLTDPFIYVFFVPHYRKVIIERVIAHNK